MTSEKRLVVTKPCFFHLGSIYIQVTVIEKLLLKKVILIKLGSTFDNLYLGSITRNDQTSYAPEEYQKTLTVSLIVISVYWPAPSHII